VKLGFVSYLSGLLFGVGLALSGMTRPDKVVGFLDVGGAWDPSLAMVMGGAVVVYAVLFRLARRMDKPVAAEQFPKIVHARVDGRLVTGAALFGAGWGLAGVCPGPGLVSLGGATQMALVFVPAMLVGMGLFSVLSLVRPLARPARQPQ
jgi:hypothetical protein